MVPMDDKTLELARQDLNTLFSSALKGVELKLTLNWIVTEKIVSEVGGRLIEDFVLMSLPAEVAKPYKGFKGKFLGCKIPVSHRAMEDIEFTWESPGGTMIKLLVDVKGHNEKKSGSRPNLASIRKCVVLYSSDENIELFIFFCRYTPTVVNHADTTAITLKIDDLSFGAKGLFLLRRLSASNMAHADIGSGGQILFAKEHTIELMDRSRAEMIIYLQTLQALLTANRDQKRKKDGKVPI